MPEFNGVSNGDRQQVYQITQAPGFIYIELTVPPGNDLTRVGYARLEFQRVVSAPFIQLAGISLWGSGAILRPAGYPPSGVGNRLILFWDFAAIPWKVFYP